MHDNRFIFIGGLHRSGTSLLFRCLREHPLVAGFRNTGAPEDEGQHLQSVYAPAKSYGGAGRFGFHAQAHLTEASHLVSEENRTKLFSDWKRYWDTDKPFLLEKSPPNLIRTRFLQAMFPESRFLILVRHPIAVAYATEKWSRTQTIYSLIRHWAVCHEIYARDRPYLRNVFELKYENLVSRPNYWLDIVYSWLGIDRYPCTEEFRRQIDKVYFQEWRKLQGNPLLRIYAELIIRSLERRVNAFGYSLRDLEPRNAQGSV